MQLKSSDFSEGAAIPVRFTRDSDNGSPPLEWSDLPAGTSELALVFECTTPSTRPPHVQWLIYGLSPELDGLPAGLKNEARPEVDGQQFSQGRNDEGNVGYDGPLGTVSQDQQYRFRLYALDAQTGAEPGLTKEEFMKKIDGLVIDDSELLAHYQRPRG